jgi:RecB family endonuclease NucS
MRILIADLSATYAGRGDTKLARGVRSVMVKSDGAISIHNDAGNKPLNYMGKGSLFSEYLDEDGILTWRFETTKENLTITMHRVVSDSQHILDLEDEGLVRDGTERQLQAWLAENPAALGLGFEVVGREIQTGHGPVDLLVKDAEGNHIAVEVKRVAMLGAVGQVLRYVTALEETGEYGPVRAMVAALDVRPKTLKLADKRGVECVTVNAAWKSRETIPASETAAA